MGTRFVPVPDWETAAALLSEGSLWFDSGYGKIVLMEAEDRTGESRYWASRMDWYLMCIED